MKVRVNRDVFGIPQGITFIRDDGQQFAIPSLTYIGETDRFADWFNAEIRIDAPIVIRMTSVKPTEPGLYLESCGVSENAETATISFADGKMFSDGIDVDNLCPREWSDRQITFETVQVEPIPPLPGHVEAIHTVEPAPDEPVSDFSPLQLTNLKHLADALADHANFNLMFTDDQEWELLQSFLGILAKNEHARHPNFWAALNTLTLLEIPVLKHIVGELLANPELEIMLATKENRDVIDEIVAERVAAKAEPKAGRYSPVPSTGPDGLWRVLDTASNRVFAYFTAGNCELLAKEYAAYLNGSDDGK